MKRNVGNLDKIIRAIIGAVFAYLGLIISYWFFIVTILEIIVIIIGYCPVYPLINFNTYKRGK